MSTRKGPGVAAAAAPGRLQRKCGCGRHTVAGGECASCQNNRRSAQPDNRGASRIAPEPVSAAVDAVQVPHALPFLETIQRWFGRRHPAQDRSGLQTELEVNEPGDVYEREADRVADQVTADGALPVANPAPQAPHTPPPPIQRLAGPSAGVAQAAPASVERALRGSGSPLEPALRQDMERRFGRNFSRVRMHTDAAAARSAGDVDASAYTVGHHVVFGPGTFEPGTPRGRHLIAHELTHVVQQGGSDATGAAGRGVGGSGGGAVVVQRQDKAAPKAPAPKAPAGKTAAGGPKLDLLAAKNSPPCACIVFIHHNEPNARLTARAMYEFCRYNLAIVSPATASRNIALPGKGPIDPNELFPRKVAEECWNDDKPCEDFMSKNAGATKSDAVEEYAQRQFFLTIKKCSNGFSLPVVGLHNNTIEDTAKYRKQVGDAKKPLDLAPIRGKTFDDTLKAGDKPPAPDTHPFADLQKWLLDNVAGVKEKKDPPAGTKNKLTTGRDDEHILKSGKTNIFLWCSAEDNSRCHIGDPQRPDNVVWVTNAADFAKLQGTKANVVLQTRVDPKGKSATDLSSLFVFLEQIVGTHFAGLMTKPQADVAVEDAAIAAADAELAKLQAGGEGIMGRLRAMVFEGIKKFHVIKRIANLKVLTDLRARRDVKQSQLRFINIETPQSPYDPATKPQDFRAQGFRDVKAVLDAVGLDCCDKSPAAGQAESASDKVEKALREGKVPTG